jgi:hypothetical protein
MDTQPTSPVGNTAQAPPTPAESVLPSVPATWPGAFGTYKYSKQAVKLNVGTLVALYVLALVVGGLLGFALKEVGQVISYLVDSVVAASFVIIFLAGIRGQRISIEQAVKDALPFWLKMIGLTILVGASLFASFILLIIPFFFVLPRLTLANYFLIDKKMGIVEAYSASWTATKGHTGKIWGIIGATILMALLMITIIGIPFSIYFLIMYSGATAILYSFIVKNPAVAAAAPNAAVAPSAPPVEPPVPASEPTPVASTSFAPSPDKEPANTPPIPPAPPTVQ